MLEDILKHCTDKIKYLCTRRAGTFRTGVTSSAQQTKQNCNVLVLVLTVRLQSICVINLYSSCFSVTEIEFQLANRL